MIAAFFIFNRKGEVLISRIFREGVRRNVSEVFRIQVISKLSDIKSPVLTLGSTSFLHIRHGPLWFVAVTRDNADASVVLEFLYNFVETLQITFLNDRNRVLTDVDVMNNFLATYEILDRIINYGYVQDWDKNTLQHTLRSGIVKGKGLKPKVSHKMKTETHKVSNAGAELIRNGTMLLSRANSTMKRKSSMLVSSSNRLNSFGNGSQQKLSLSRSKKSKISLSVHEDVNLLMSHDGAIIRAFVEGSIHADTDFINSPICSFRLIKRKNKVVGKYRKPNNEDAAFLSDGYDNIIDSDEEEQTEEDDTEISTIGEQSENKDDYDTVEAEFNADGRISEHETSSGAKGMLKDCNFNNCVSLQDFDIEGIIRFTPVSAQFEVMKYRTDITNLPFMVYSNIASVGANKFKYVVRLKSHYSKNNIATDVSLKIPTPPNSLDAEITVDMGKAKFLAAEGCVEWKFKKAIGQRICQLTATVCTSDITTNDGTRNSWRNSKPPISMQFNMGGFSTSGYRVMYLKVEEPVLKYSTVKTVEYSSSAKSYEIRI